MKTKIKLILYIIMTTVTKQKYNLSKNIYLHAKNLLMKFLFEEILTNSTNELIFDSCY